MTAFLRPLAGDGIWQEVFERGGNCGLLVLVLVGVGDRTGRSWFKVARPRPLPRSWPPAALGGAQATSGWAPTLRRTCR
ncbi:MAG: hypothetical protein ACRD1K_14190 [Acidimicrobiales bacterium]